MSGESSLSISYFLFLSDEGFAETLLTQGHERGSRQYQASLAHFLWFSQQPEGALVLLGLGRDCPVPDPPPDPLFLLGLFLCGLRPPGLKAAT